MMEGPADMEEQKEETFVSEITREPTQETAFNNDMRDVMRDSMRGVQER